MIKNRDPLPAMDRLRYPLGKAQGFTKFDLKNGFQHLRLWKGEELKSTFRSGYGVHKYTVIPIGLFNAHSTFQTIINALTLNLLSECLIS